MTKLRKSSAAACKLEVRNVPMNCIHGSLERREKLNRGLKPTLPKMVLSEVWDVTAFGAWSIRGQDK